MNNKKILKNTLMLYIRQILIIVVGLYTIRVVLDVLGVEDYGVYGVVASIVTMCTFLSGSLASSTQRFFSFALGKNDTNLLNETFSVSFIVYGFLCLISLLLLEIFGYWYVKEFLILPVDRVESALILYHYSCATFIFSIITAPFIAIIIAHEDMHLFALMSIVEVSMKLGIVFSLPLFSIDKLEAYGLMLLLVSIVTSAIYGCICISKYKECQFKKIYWNKDLLKKMYSFTGWTLFGQLSTIFRNQVITILLNQFFSPTTVAARTIAVNVASQVSVFASKFNTGLYPPIIKSYAKNEKDQMFSLIYFGSKLTYTLMWFFSLPLMLELKSIFDLWLVDYPKETLIFAKLAIIESLIFSLSLPVATAARAPGKMKVYELPLGIIQFLIVVFSYICLKLGYGASVVFVIAIIANLLMFIVRLYIVSILIDLPVKTYLSRVLVPVANMTVCSLLFSVAISDIFGQGVVHRLVFLATCAFIILFISYFICLDKKWRAIINSKVRSRVTKYIN
ncbi:oligosaccharide flippase family protein [Vibrio fluvialis]|uniref:oligosaccharide flippase family protein n=1 Tax=Vibrio fluvialis TaxID=676 RepID=UPI001F312926|nr:oligosaccharide flippase family protein [Vibrio fluvialis]MCE7650698.1 oligosaccharide flippase family protein [Vibrio fluvialis]